MANRSKQSYFLRNGSEILLPVMHRKVNMVMFPMNGGIEPERLLLLTKGSSTNSNMPISGGIEPFK